MPKNIHLVIREPSSDVTVPSQFDIPDDDWARLVVYAVEVERLMSTETLREGFRATVRIQWNKKDGGSFHGQLPSDDAVAAILHRVRPFVLQEEHCSFFRTRNALARYLTNADLRHVLDSIRDQYSGKSFQRQCKISISSPELMDTLNSEESFQTWLNAFEYHFDPDKRTKVDAIRGCLPLAAARGIFIVMLIDKLKAIGELARLIRWLEAPNSEELSLRIEG